MNPKDTYYTEHKIHRILCDGKVGPKFLDYLKDRFNVTETKGDRMVILEEKDDKKTTIQED